MPRKPIVTLRGSNRFAAMNIYLKYDPARITGVRRFNRCPAEPGCALPLPNSVDPDQLASDLDLV